MLKHSSRDATTADRATLVGNPPAYLELLRREGDGNRDTSAQSYLAAIEPLAWIAGNLAHEFNNLLTTVMGNLSMAMLDLPEQAPVVEMLKEAAQAVTQASTVTRQLQEFSRRQPTHRMSTCLGPLIDGLLPALERITGPRIYIRTLHESDAGVVCVDPRHFEMVITNLIRNAKDAMPEGGVVVIETSNVTVTQKRAENGLLLTPGNYVAMRVIDQGCGMEPQIVERLFVPFFTTKSPGQGSGLGLAAIRAALRQTGGGIEVSSVPRVGTTVTIYYPRHKAGEQVAPSKARTPRQVLTNDGPATILLVEDEPALRNLGQRILERLGYRVLSASNGQEAMELAENYAARIDLLFTDVVMPGMNGRELADRLAQMRPEMPVLFTSGYTERVFACEPMGGSVDPLVPSRCAEYLSKPYKPEALAARIRSVLGGEQVDQPGQIPADASGT